MHDRRPFFTGSYAYGTPTETSNTDLVVLMSEALDTYPGVRSIYFGSLRLIFVNLPEEYDAWLAATQRMMEWRAQGYPVPKEIAIAEIDKEHELRGLIAMRRNLRIKHGMNPIEETPIEG